MIARVLHVHNELDASKPLVIPYMPKERAKGVSLDVDGELHSAEADAEADVEAEAEPADVSPLSFESHTESDSRAADAEHTSTTHEGCPCAPNRATCACSAPSNTPAANRSHSLAALCMPPFRSLARLCTHHVTFLTAALLGIAFVLRFRKLAFFYRGHS